MRLLLALLLAGCCAGPRVITVEKIKPCVTVRPDLDKWTHEQLQDWAAETWLACRPPR